MQQKKIRIGIFASSQSLIERVQVLAARQHDQIFINTQGLDDAIPVALEMVRNGVETIISRRGTAHLLRENLRIPVLSFPHRSLDILISLKQAAALGGKILLPVFRQQWSGLPTLEDMLQIELIQKVYEDKASLKRIIANAYDEGCEIVVGGSVTQQIAEAEGIKFIEIRTSDEDIAATIEDAKSIALSARDQEAAALRYHAIIDAASDGIIAVDEEGSITTINATAASTLKLDRGEVEGRHITQIIPDSPIDRVLLTQNPIYDRLTRIGKDRYVFNYRPVTLEDTVIGAVSTFRDIGNVMRSEHVVRRSLSKGLVAKYDFKDLIHASPTMRDVVNIGRQYAGTESTILVMGETGTGKEIFVHGIHSLSQRADQPFVSVNCAALPEQLLESELFGYEEGAFTGSKKGGKPGRFEIAHKGTIFLDEIGDIPLSVQVKLLRVIENKQIERVGDHRSVDVDVRIISATHQNLVRLIEQQQFREDLYFRINVIPIRIPPLRDRREDIPLLINSFVQRLRGRTGKAITGLTSGALRHLMDYPWPGNVRELKSALEYAFVVAEKGKIDLEHLPVPATEASSAPRRSHRPAGGDTEKQALIDALRQTGGNQTQAARILGINRVTVWNRMRKYGIDLDKVVNA